MIAALAFLASCAHGGVDTTLSIRELDCNGCAEEAVDRLRGEPGVREVSFDDQKVELRVRHDPDRPTPARLAEVARGDELTVVVGAGQGSWQAQVTFPSGADVAWISRSGEEVDLAAHLAPGKFTVFDYYADWCGPCKDVDRAMKETLEKRTDIAVRKLNVVDWDSPLARSHLARVTSLPYVVVHGRDGRRVAAISGLDLDALRRALEDGAQ